MAEVQIAAGQVLNFAEKKDPELCRVKFCWCKRLPHKSLCSRHKQMMWRLRNPMASAYHSLKAGAIRRRLPFELTFDQFKELVSTTRYMEAKGNKPDSLHLDRIDPNKGYVMSNLQVVTCSENCSKGSYERWITLASGERVRLYEIHIGTQTEAQHHEIWYPPSWLDSNIDEPF